MALLVLRKISEPHRVVTVRSPEDWSPLVQHSQSVNRAQERENKEAAGCFALPIHPPDSHARISRVKRVNSLRLVKPGLGGLTMSDPAGASISTTGAQISTASP